MYFVLLADGYVRAADYKCFSNVMSSTMTCASQELSSRPFESDAGAP